MDWAKVAELRKKVLAEEEALVQAATKNDKKRKRLGGRVRHGSKRSSGVLDREDEQERKIREFFGWDPRKNRKRGRK